MLWKTWDFIQNFWNGAKENFLIIEQTNGAYEVTRASRNLKKKRISITKSSSVKNLRDVRRPFRKTDKVVIALASDSATTAESVITLKRSRPKEMINEGEVDQLVYQAFWAFLNRYRGMAIRKMGVSDMDLIAAYVQIRDVSLGKNKVLNPVGFNGPEISFRIRGTLIPRNILAALEKFKDWGRLFVFEKASVLGGALNRANLSGGCDFTVQVGERTAVVFKIAKEEEVFEDVIDWGTDSLSRALSVDLGISDEAAQSVLHAYLKGGVSGRMGKWAGRKIAGCFENLGVLLETIRKRSKVAHSRFYFDFRLADPIPIGQLKKIRGALFRADEELERREFVLSGQARQSTLAILFFEYDLPKFEAVNQFLRRRVRWLIPNF